MQFIKKIRLDETTFIEYNLMIFRKKNIITWIIVGVAIMLAYVYFNGAGNFLLSVWIGIGLGILFLGFSYVFSRININKSAKIMYQKQSLSSLDLVYIINSDGVSQGHNHENFNFPWSKMKSMKETDLGFYFFYARLSALAVAKETLSEEEIVTIRKITETNLNKKRK